MRARTGLWLPEASREGRRETAMCLADVLRGVNVRHAAGDGVVLRVPGTSADCFQPSSCTCRGFSVAVDPLTEDPPALRGDVRRRRSGALEETE
ncbi:hypothetical protein TcBrA4_0094890 [Trypanosoma cruzi]|nr:hypothetical protein TcBrA4_0094890 [Trypanosoma cruzi]